MVGRLAVYSCVLAHGAAAWADVPPPPLRPHWYDPPAPMPTPPEVVALVVVFALIVGAMARAIGRSRGASKELV